MSGIFNASIFNNAIFNTGESDQSAQWGGRYRAARRRVIAEDDEDVKEIVALALKAIGYEEG